MGVWTRRHAAEATIGGPAVRVGRGTVDDPKRRTRHELDVVAVDDHGRVLAIGEAKLRPLDADDRARLVHLRGLLEERGRAGTDTRLLLVGPEGADVPHRADTEVIDLDRLYTGH